MTIEPSNTNPLTIGVLIHENKSLKSTLEILTREHDDLQKRYIQQFEDYEKRIKVQQHLILRVQEEEKRTADQSNYAHSRLAAIMKERDVALAKLDSISTTNKTATEVSEMQTLKEQVETHEKTIDILNGRLNGYREANQILSNKNKELEKLLKEEKEAYIRLKSLRHAANYGMGAKQFEDIMLKKSPNKQTATEVLEENNLKIDTKKLVERKYQLITELRHSEQMYKRLANELIAERAAHNKLKALCNERGFGTQLFYTPPALQTHKWVVCFYRDGLEVGTITYSYSPTTSKLNALQESLNATSWKMTYSHD